MSLERALRHAQLQQVLGSEQPSHPLAETGPWLQRRIEPSCGHDCGGRLHQASGSCCRAAQWGALSWGDPLVWAQKQSQEEESQGARTPASLFGSPRSHARQEMGERKGAAGGSLPGPPRLQATAGHVGWGKGGQREGSHLAAASRRRLRGPARRRCHRPGAGVGKAKS